MESWIAIAQLVLLGLVLVLVLWLALRRGDNATPSGWSASCATTCRTARAARAGAGASLSAFQQTLLAQPGDVARTQNEQIDCFRTQLAATQQDLARSRSAAREQQARRCSASPTP